MFFMTNEFNFTATEIKKLNVPDKGREYYKDTKEKGLSLYITSTGVVTFFVRKRVHGKDERLILGNFPEISVENARKIALQIKAKVSEGSNPNEEKHRLRDDLTFKELFDQFMERYSKKQKKSWQYDEREVNKFLSHWFGKKISRITKQEIQQLHERIAENNGIYQANRILERIRAIYNKAIEWGWNGVNPTSGIKKYREKKRERFLMPEELPKFFEALSEEHNETARDFILISLFTGARKSNVLAMQWKDVDWHHKTWRIPETKNGDAVIIPLIDDAIEVLQRRKALAINGWVFPSETSSSGHFADPKKAWKRVLTKAGIEDLRIHDIRRTLGSYQAIAGSSLSIIGKSLGHKSQQATQIYARLHNDPVKESMEKAAALMFKDWEK